MCFAKGITEKDVFRIATQIEEAFQTLLTTIRHVSDKNYDIERKGTAPSNSSKEILNSIDACSKEIQASLHELKSLANGRLDSLKTTSLKNTVRAGEIYLTCLRLYRVTLKGIDGSSKNGIFSIFRKKTKAEEDIFNLIGRKIGEAQDLLSPVLYPASPK